MKHISPEHVDAAATSLRNVGLNRLQITPLLQFLIATSKREDPAEVQVSLAPEDFIYFCDTWFGVPGHADRPWFVPLGTGWVRTNSNHGYPVSTLWSTMTESSSRRDRLFTTSAVSTSERVVTLVPPTDLLNGLRELLRAGSSVKRLPLRQLAVWRHRFADLPDEVTLSDLEQQVTKELGLTPLEAEVLLSPAGTSDADVFVPGPADADSLVSLLPEPASTQGQLEDLVSSAGAPGAGDVDALVEVELDDQLWRVLRNAVASFPCVLLVGPPGTGKGQILARLAQEAAQHPDWYGFDASRHEATWPDPVVKTPHEGWQTFDLVGGPIADPSGGLRWAPGFLLDALRDDRWVVLDETNRGDMDRIMGPVITWLAGGTAEIGATSTGESRRPITLGWTQDAACRTTPVEGVDAPDDALAGQVSYLAGQDWRLLGSFNPQDAQRVFGIGQALGRRFKVVPIPPLAKGKFADLMQRRHPTLPEDARARIASLYGSHLHTEDALLGPALFLDMARYVVVGLGPVSDTDPTPASTDAGPPPSQAVLVAEAYVVAVGRFLASLEPTTLAEVRANSGNAMSGSEWDWVEQHIRPLGI